MGIIYKISNSINDKVYIGQTVGTAKDRLKVHIRHTKNNSTHTVHKAMRKYGIENFWIEEIDGANAQDELNYKEWLYVHQLNGLSPNGYNMREGGGNRGKNHPDTCAKLSKAGLDFFSQAGNKEKRSITMINYFKDPENKRKQIDGFNNYFKDPENIKTHSDRMINYFKDPENKRKRSEMSNNYWDDMKKRQEQSDRMINYFKDPENKKKQSDKICSIKGGKLFEVFDKINGNKIGEWVNMNQAALVLNIHRSTIRLCLKQNRNTTNYIIKYKE